MGQRAKWALPDPVEPGTRRCFIVQVPDEPHHIAAFRGALYELAKPYAWGDDEAHTALDVGELWSELWANITEVDCGMLDLQFRVCETGCGLEYSVDGGANWTCIDLTTCITSLAQDAIQNAIDDGTLEQPGGQPSPENPPVPGECSSFHVVLEANSKWKLPFAINTGDTLEITDYFGGWTDGAFLWYCADGKSYVLNTCGNDNAFQGADPLQAGNHMQLIGGYDTVAPVYFDPLSGIFTVPAGVVDQEAWIQANDDPIYDDAGQVNFDITICTGAWCHEWDFTASSGGDVTYPFAIHELPEGGTFGTYIVNQGYRTDGSKSLWVRSVDFLPASRIYRYEADVTLDGVTVHQHEIWTYPPKASDYQWEAAHGSGTALVSRTVAIDIPTDHYFWFGCGITGNSVTIHKIRLFGTGENPFGASNC
jgi:hypothetical protein